MFTIIKDLSLLTNVFVKSYIAAIGLICKRVSEGRELHLMYLALILTQKSNYMSIVCHNLEYNMSVCLNPVFSKWHFVPDSSLWCQIYKECSSYTYILKSKVNWIEVDCACCPHMIVHLTYHHPVSGLVESMCAPIMDPKNITSR